MTSWSIISAMYEDRILYPLFMHYLLTVTIVPQTKGGNAPTLQLACLEHAGCYGFSNEKTSGSVDNIRLVLGRIDYDTARIIVKGREHKVVRLTSRPTRKYSWPRLGVSEVQSWEDWIVL